MGGDFASQVSPSRSATPSETEEQRLAELRNDAVDYIDRFDLRQLMTDMFQQVIRDKPENPLKFMQDYLCHDVSRSRSSTSVSHTGRPPPPAESEVPIRWRIAHFLWRWRIGQSCCRVPPDASCRSN